MVPTGSALDELDDDDALLPEPPVLDDAKPLVVVEA
jgi:2-methylaconitate cis-trans-isomerase PrpF